MDMLTKSAKKRTQPTKKDNIIALVMFHAGAAFSRLGGLDGVMRSLGGGRAPPKPPGPTGRPGMGESRIPSRFCRYASDPYLLDLVLPVP